jgi:hypothetical protein
MLGAGRSGSRLAVGVALGQPEQAAQQLEQDQKRHGLAVSGAVGLVDVDSLRSAALDELCT